MAALHITVGYNAGVPKVLYIGSDATAANIAYENDKECERYQLLKHCAGLRKGPKAAPAPVTLLDTSSTFPMTVQETEPEPEESPADESETASAPRRGRPPKNKE